MVALEEEEEVVILRVTLYVLFFFCNAVEYWPLSLWTGIVNRGTVAETFHIRIGDY